MIPVKTSLWPFFRVEFHPFRLPALPPAPLHGLRNLIRLRLESHLISAQAIIRRESLSQMDGKPKTMKSIRSKLKTATRVSKKQTLREAKHPRSSSLLMLLLAYTVVTTLRAILKVIPGNGRRKDRQTNGNRLASIG